MPSPARKETTDELLARMRATYGGAPSAAPEPVAAPAPAPAPVQKREPTGLLQRAAGLMKGRTEQIDRAAGYANGGMVGILEDPTERANAEKTARWALQDQASKIGYDKGASAKPMELGLNDYRNQFGENTSLLDDVNHRLKLGYAQGGKIAGPGTATSDSIPAKVQETGEPIKVSNTERIVSAKQEVILERIAEMLGFETVDAMFESMTGVPVGPTVKGGTLAAETGLSPYEEGRKKILSQMAPQKPAPTGPQVYGDVGLPDGFLAGTKAAIQGAGDDAQAAAAQGNYGAAVGHVGRGALAGVVGLADDAMRGAKVALDPAANALKTLVTGDSSPASPQPQQAAPVVKPAMAPAAAAQPDPAQVAQPAPAAQQPDAISGARRVTEAGRPTMYTNVEPGGRVLDDSASAKRDAQSGDPYWAPAAQLERMQMRRMMSDATDPTITDPSVRETAQKGLALLTAAQNTNSDTEMKKALLGQTKTIEAMRSKLLDRSTPPEERAALLENLRAINGRAGSDKYTSHVVGGGVNEMGQAQPQHLAVTNPDGTVQFHSPGQQAQPQGSGAPSFTSPAQLEAAKRAGQVKPGDVVQTPNGMMVVK